MEPLARTFDLSNEGSVTVKILSAPNTNGLCRCRLGARVVVRHVTQLSPLNEEAKKIITAPSD